MKIYKLTSVLILALFLGQLAGCADPNEFTVEKSERLKEMLAESVIGEQPDVMSNDEITAYIGDFQSTQPIPVEPGEFAIMETSKGTIIMEFYPDSAANHCVNFKRLANNGFYDWVTFHRIIPGFMIQSGCILSKNDNPDDDGIGDPGYKIDAEFNGISHERGILSMARSQAPNSAGSQFFIVHESAPSLDYKYTVFGKVVEGIEVVDEIANVQRTERDRPIENVYIKKVRVFKPDN